MEVTQCQKLTQSFKCCLATAFGFSSSIREGPTTLTKAITALIIKHLWRAHLYWALYKLSKADMALEEQTGGIFYILVMQSPISMISAGLCDETRQGTE